MHLIPTLIGHKYHKAMQQLYRNRMLSVFLLIFFCPTTYAEDVLFTAQYEGKFSGMTIKSTRKLIAQDDGQYRLESIIKNTLATVIETSQFDLNNGSIIPRHYHYKRSIMGFKADETIDFDWHQYIAHYRREGKESKNRDHSIRPGDLDPALYQLQLQRDLYSQKHELSYEFVKPNKIKNLTFASKGEEDISVGKTKFQGIMVERINLDDKDVTRLWVIPELKYQIARIEHIEENGESYSIYLTDFRSSPNLVDTFYKNK